MNEAVENINSIKKDIYDTVNNINIMKNNMDNTLCDINELHFNILQDKENTINELKELESLQKQIYGKLQNTLK